MADTHQPNPSSNATSTANGPVTSNGGASLEKDFTNGYGHGNLNNNNLTMGTNDGDALQRVRTAGSISIPPELFEKLYLSPENRVKGDLRKTFGNPTPLYVLHVYLGRYKEEVRGAVSHYENMMGNWDALG